MNPSQLTSGLVLVFALLMLGFQLRRLARRQTQLDEERSLPPLAYHFMAAVCFGMAAIVLLVTLVTLVTFR